MEHIIHGSLTRIADLNKVAVQPLPRADWEWADYVLGEVIDPPASSRYIELFNGRKALVDVGDRVLGAFATRFATLEATGSWENIGDDGAMSAMTGAGLFGAITSRSPLLDELIKMRYVGHVTRDGVKLNMRDFASPHATRKLEIPVLLIVGSSMSAGKTNSARIIIRRLKKMGLTVVAAKLTGAGRYRDVLSMGDAGADYIFDFVDAGLPSTVCPEGLYREAITNLLARIAELSADVLVVEAGASPLEPYNGQVATSMLEGNLRMMVLCASDPYSVVGMIQAFGRRPDVVAGIACNTEAGMSLIDRLTGLPVLRLIDRDSHAELDQMLKQQLT
ncbi:MAG: NAD-dependent epimerase/dehydratase family protein [Gammaproteobacteria bacterium]|nr:NAD-dependent epimerase/dehydratase family protein [Gammaproteobacteria bacterium]